MTLKEKAEKLDKIYPTHAHLFHIPTFETLGIENANFHPTTPSIYLCGNSLGLMPKQTRRAITEQLDAWSARAVESHFNHPTGTNWVDVDLPLVHLLAPIVGCNEREVCAMGSLTSNLNALLIHFYKPQGRRTKILFEKHAFPSDYYAFLNMVQLFGYDESHLIQVEVDAAPGKTYLETESILRVFDAHADEVALVCFPGIQYYTGQLFDMERITHYVKHKQPEVVVGWDLAHAVGNVELHLHEWGVDFAAWCSYKYLNSGPGAIAGIYVHEKHTVDNTHKKYTPRLAGWWGNNSEDRFKMLEKFDPIASALSYRQSNPSVIDCVALQSSLQIFEHVGGVATLRRKSLDLTRFLWDILVESKYYIPQNEINETKFGFKILTPKDPQQRGSQLSLLFQPHRDDKRENVMERVFEHLHRHAIICDERRPDVIRLAPLPLYNTFNETLVAATRLFEALELLAKDYV
ncbi:uncharacterized protein LODBEIA_P04660 [Lodderomyces beijingensis]|uniref:Kynureninase n=1 Tax=Lodderomyces beijingensis TaxID=1775926 RepID=A0ABP0ZJ83_9ASCO